MGSLDIKGEYRTSVCVCDSKSIFIHKCQTLSYLVPGLVLRAGIIRTRRRRCCHTDRLLAVVIILVFTIGPICVLAERKREIDQCEKVLLRSEGNETVQQMSATHRLGRNVPELFGLCVRVCALKTLVSFHNEAAPPHVHYMNHQSLYHVRTDRQRVHYLWTTFPNSRTSILEREGGCLGIRSSRRVSQTASRRAYRCDHIAKSPCMRSLGLLSRPLCGKASFTAECSCRTVPWSSSLLLVPGSRHTSNAFGGTEA